LIASGDSVALGAPCFFGGVGEGDSSGVAVGDGVALGVSVGSGVGEDFFFRLGDALGDGEGEGFFFLTDGVTDGAGDSCSVGRDDFFFGEGVGEGDGLFVAEELFFFRGLGVGVGVEKIFLIVSLSDCSAARAGAIVETISASAIRMRINIAKGLTD
jgi:hypothetical protein